MLQKLIDSIQKAFISRVMCILIWTDALYLTTFGLLNESTCPSHYKAWKSNNV